MVTFICQDCNKTLKKRQVERHLSICHSNSFLCIGKIFLFVFRISKGCKNTYTAESQNTHIQCDITQSFQKREPGKWYWRFEIANSLRRVNLYVLFMRFPGWRSSFKNKNSEKGYHQKIQNLQNEWSV